MTFLHQIVTFDNKDPVRQIQQQQLKLPLVKNWENEIQQKLNKSDISVDPQEIKTNHEKNENRLSKQRLQGKYLRHQQQEQNEEAKILKIQNTRLRH